MKAKRTRNLKMTRQQMELAEVLDTLKVGHHVDILGIVVLRQTEYVYEIAGQLYCFVEAYDLIDMMVL